MANQRVPQVALCCGVLLLLVCPSAQQGHAPHSWSSSSCADLLEGAGQEDLLVNSGELASETETGSSCRLTWHSPLARQAQGTRLVMASTSYSVPKVTLQELLARLRAERSARAAHSASHAGPWDIPLPPLGPGERLGVQFSSMLCFPRLTLAWQRLSHGRSLLHRRTCCSQDCILEEMFKSPRLPTLRELLQRASESSEALLSGRSLGYCPLESRYSFSSTRWNVFRTSDAASDPAASGESGDTAPVSGGWLPARMQQLLQRRERHRTARSRAVADEMLFWLTWLVAPGMLVAFEALSLGDEYNWMTMFVCVIAALCTVAEWRAVALAAAARHGSGSERAFALGMSYTVTAVVVAMITGLVTIWLALLGLPTSTHILWGHLALMPIITVWMGFATWVPPATTTVAATLWRTPSGGSVPVPRRRSATRTDGGAAAAAAAGGAAATAAATAAAAERLRSHSSRDRAIATTAAGGSAARAPAMQAGGAPGTANGSSAAAQASVQPTAAGTGGAGDAQRPSAAQRATQATSAAAAAAAAVHWPPPLDVPPWLDEECDVPDAFRCPITLSIMREPTSASSGITYERHAIFQWLQLHRVDPVSHVPLKRHRLAPNLNLRSMVENWVRTKMLEQAKGFGTVAGGGGGGGAAPGGSAAPGAGATAGPGAAMPSRVGS